MLRKLLLPLLATVFTLGYHQKAKSQDNDGDRKVRIEITTNENGKTEHITREFDLDDDQALEDALRELGVFEQMGLINDGENLVIDLKRMAGDGGTLRDMSVALACQEALQPGALLGVYCDDASAIDGEKDKEKNKEKEGSSSKDQKAGARITGVIEGSGAEAAGLKEGDVITALDETKINGFGDLIAAVDGHEPGDEVQVTYWREGKKDKVNATLSEEQYEPHTFTYNYTMPEMTWSTPDVFTGEPHGFLGVDGEDVENNGGARITEVIEGTSAERMGIQEGDVIKKVNDTPIMSFGTLAEVIGSLEPGTPVNIEVERNGAPTSVSGELGAQELPDWEMMASPSVPDAPGMPAPPAAAPRMYMLERQAHSESMRREMDQLRHEMDQLRHELRGEIRTEMKVVIATIQLDEKESEVLKSKGVTGLDANWQLPDLRCYPNPSSGNFHLEFDVPERGDLAVDIYNAAGERVYHETITGYKGRYERMLDLSDQNDGTYFLVILQNGKALARKLVKE